MADRLDRSATAATFALLRWLPLQSSPTGQSPSVDDVIYARALLTRLIATAFALAVLSIAPAFATADGEEGAGANAAPVQCVAVDGSLVPAPAGTPGGAPAPCPSSDPETPPPPPPPPAPEPEPQPQPPAQTPLDQPAPSADPAPPAAGETPVTGPTTGGTPTTQKPKTPKNTKSRPEPKVEKKRPTKRRERGTGPDDSAPPAPPSSLLQEPVPDTGPSSASPLGPYVLPAPTTRGVPNILLDGFRVPPFLLPIYQAAGVQYGVSWEILAAINSIETDYGRNLNVSTAGALGWMQFMPATWASYGVDANNDGRRDPYNPVDAIFAAARYLRAAGAQQDLRKAIWAYNHADWYVNDVLRRAQRAQRAPARGRRLPVRHDARPLPGRRARDVRRASEHQRRPREGQAATPRSPSRAARSAAAASSPSPAPPSWPSRTRASSRSAPRRAWARTSACATPTGTRTPTGTSRSSRRVYPVARPRKQSAASIRRELGVVASDPAPRARRQRRHAAARERQARRRAQAARTAAARPAPGQRPRRRQPGDRAGPRTVHRAGRRRRRSVGRRRPAALALHGRRHRRRRPPGVRRRQARAHDHPAARSPRASAPSAPSSPSLRRSTAATSCSSRCAAAPRSSAGRCSAASAPRRSSFEAPQGSDAAAERRAEAATAARLQRTQAPHLYFEVRPAGRKTPRIDPKPLLDGWRLLDSTAIYRARNPVLGADRAVRRLSTGQIMLMSKEQLIRHVLDNPDIEIYSCGRADIRAGIIDRRVLVSMAFLAARGMKPTVTSLRCGHGYFTAGGNVSHHSSGDALDIAAINGVPIAGNQGPGSITDRAVRALLTLQGTLKPAQVITLMQYAGTDNTLRDGRPLGPHPRRVPARRRRRRQHAAPRAVGPPRVGPGAHPQPGRPDPAQPLVDQRHQARPEGGRQADPAGRRRAAAEGRALAREADGRAGPPAGRRRPPARGLTTGVGAPALFAFVQVEVPWILGPADGRYIVRGHAGEPEYVLVDRDARRARQAADARPPPRRAPASRPAVRDARHRDRHARHADRRASARREPGERWLRDADLQAEADRGIAVLNRVLHAQRIATADPGVAPLTRARALAVRVGVGAGEQVADGRWTSAALVPPPAPGRGSRSAGLRPTERLAAMLANRDVALACEELTLRARSDADADRWRDCAFQLRAAYDAALTELLPWSGQADIDERLAELAELQPGVAAAADTARQGGIDDDRIAAVTHALARLEAALRARTNAQLGA